MSTLLKRLFLALLLLGLLGSAIRETTFAECLKISSPGTQTEQLQGVAPAPARIIPTYWRKFPTGTLNAITDVPGIQVGQLSLLQDQPVIIRTGLTAIVPKSPLPNGNLANTGFPAAASILNGNGEVTGIAAILHSGLLNGPIILTNTPSVGIASQGVQAYFQQFFPDLWASELPVVAECWDGFFNTLDAKALQPEDVITAIRSARNGPVAQGRVGAGTGMRSFEMHGGIGSASRKIQIDNREYTLGVLVNSNHSRLDELNPLLKDALEAHWQKPPAEIRERDNQDRATQRPPQPRQGSIIIVIATDLPVDAHALQAMTNHAALGIAQAGGHMAVTSGDFALAFSTANATLMGNMAPTFRKIVTLHPQQLTPVFQAMTEAIVGAQLNALVASHHSLPN